MGVAENVSGRLPARVVARLEMATEPFVAAIVRGSWGLELEAALESHGRQASVQLIRYSPFCPDVCEVRNDVTRQVRRCVRHVRSVVMKGIVLGDGSYFPLDTLAVESWAKLSHAPHTCLSVVKPSVVA